MEYNDVVTVLNRHIFEGDKRSLLEKIAKNPERYIGLFRPTKPKAKLLQNILQSHEIRFDDAMESLIEQMLADVGFPNLPKNLQSVDSDSLSIEQYFTNGEKFFFMEQKVRDDHDSTFHHMKVLMKLWAWNLSIGENYLRMIDGIIEVLFSDGVTLELVLGYFSKKHSSAYQILAVQ